MNFVNLLGIGFNHLFFEIYKGGRSLFLIYLAFK